LGARTGYDDVKRCKGSKVHAAVHTLGPLLALHVTAEEQDRAQVDGSPQKCNKSPETMWRYPHHDGNELWMRRLSTHPVRRRTRAASGTEPFFTQGRICNEIERLFRRLEGFRRIFSRFEKLDVLFLGFLNFALIIEALR
jgi:hypothetical protein